MRILIVTMDDPTITNKFIKKVIKHRRKDIIGVCTSKGGRLKVYNKSRLEYLFCLFWILGPVKFFENIFKSLTFKLDNIICKALGRKSKLSILYYSEKLAIPTYESGNPNDSVFLNLMQSLMPDIVINQSQHILTKDFLKIPTIGVLNRHNSLLPKHKGRISPFWVLYNRERETGVSIHFVNEKIDKGDIIYQFRYKTRDYDFNNLVRLNYKIADLAMLKALKIIEDGSYQPLDISHMKGNYNSTPTFMELIDYLKIRYA